MFPRSVILALGISLDGYICRLDGRADFLFMDPAYDWAAFLRRVDTTLLGRKSLEDAISIHGGGQFDSQGLRTIVFSHTLDPGLHQRFEVTRNSPEHVVEELRTQPGKDLWLGGGGELVKSFLHADLVDRMEIGVVPTLIGEGRPLFPAGFPERKFRLLEAKSYPRTGLLTLSYERVRPSYCSE